MMDRRTFAISALLGSLASQSLATESSFHLNPCSGSCFNSDLPVLGYEQYYWSLFDLASASELRAEATGHRIRPEMTSLFEGDKLYNPLPDTLSIEWEKKTPEFRLLRFHFDLECRMPIIGCLGLPNTTPRGLIILGHGMSSVPERCFVDSERDYMNGIGKKLCKSGFAVWCPFMIQEGNQTSQNHLAAMLLSRGISLHNVSCSALIAGEQLASRLSNVQFAKIGIYGVSWSAFLALHLAAAISLKRPVVASGYLRDESSLLASTSFMKSLTSEFATYIHFNPNKFKFAGAELASLLERFIA